MKVKSKHCVCIAFLFIIIGTLVFQNVYAGDLTAYELRKRASILKDKINLCEQDLAGGANECFVIVNWENNRKVSIAEAENLASQYLRAAQNIDSRILPRWSPAELSNPRIYRIAMSLDSIQVPPPISAREASINWNVASDNSNMIFDGVDYGLLAWDIGGKIGTKTIYGKVALIAGKIFLAGEEGAFVFVTKKNETYERALKYLKNPSTSKQFADLVRELKEKGDISTAADPDIIKAVRAIADPSLGNSSMKLAWDAMLSPEATAAMAKKACLEIGTELFTTGVSNLSVDLERRKGIFDSIRLERNKAVNMLKSTADPVQGYELNRVIAHANKQLAFTYRTEEAGPAILGFMARQYLYKEADK